MSLSLSSSILPYNPPKPPLPKVAKLHLKTCPEKEMLGREDSLYTIFEGSKDSVAFRDMIQTTTLSEVAQFVEKAKNNQ